MSLDLVRLGKLLALAGSENESEAMAAIRKLKTQLVAEGLSFTDLGQRLMAQAGKAADAGGRPPPPAAPSFTDEAGVVWPSREAHDTFQAAAAARRDKDWQRTEVERTAVIARYGSREAALARSAREQMLHDAVADLLVRQEPDTDPPGRWHASLGGWDRSMMQPPDMVRARIDQALPLPVNVRQAKDEFDYWTARSRELEMLMGRPGDSQLDLPAVCRARRVQALYERELPIRSIDDLHLRLQFSVNPEWVDETGEGLPQILEAFEALIIAPAQDAPPAEACPSDA
ncbi:hypothetical protein V5F77_22515 [Xanthobacter sp. DSM 24535]|uniref:hypothetical protein n=1 Tax=Roseixanthobacter psychrophilus TaxID=3119917 RepID=UPI0037277B81